MTLEDGRNKVGDYFTLQRGTTYKSRLLGHPGPVLLGLGSIQRNGGFRGDSLQSYGGDSPAKLLVQPGELYLSLKDVTQSADLLGAVARLPLDQPAGRLTQDTVKLEPIGSDVPLGFLYWLLRTPQYRDYCRAHATGTTNLGLAREDFLSFPVPEPTASRLRLADTLEDLDHKIQLNRLMSETLDSLSRSLFKSWFVDFEPVRAKVEGKLPTLPSDTGGLFPDSFEDSALGPIPKGWSIGSLTDVADFLNGLALQKYPAGEGESIPVVKIPEMRRGFSDTSGRASARLDPTYVVQDGDVLFSWSGSLEVRLWTHGPGALNQHLFKVSSGRTPRWFYYGWLLEHLPGLRDIAKGKATTMGHIQRHHLSEAKVVIPPRPLLTVMTSYLEPLLELLVTSGVEWRTLQAIQNALLPGLIPDSAIQANNVNPAGT